MRVGWSMGLLRTSIKAKAGRVSRWPDRTRPIWEKRPGEPLGGMATRRAAEESRRTIARSVNQTECLDEIGCGVFMIV